MNKLAIALSAALSLGAVGSANAADATITFSGEITSVTCAIGIEGAGASGLALTMPIIALDKIAASNTDDTKREAPFKINLGGSTKCPAGKTAEMVFSGANINADGALKNTGTDPTDADGVEMVLVHKNTVLDLSSGTAATESVNGDGKAVYDMKARYRMASSGTPRAGNFATSVDLTVTYR